MTGRQEVKGFFDTCERRRLTNGFFVYIMRTEIVNKLCWGLFMVVHYKEGNACSKSLPMAAYA